ncbi:hypothetical protein L4D76_00450 [Photobacterium sagamiensis]
MSNDTVVHHHKTESMFNDLVREDIKQLRDKAIGSEVQSDLILSLL